MLEQDLWLRAADDIAWELRQAQQEGRTIPQELQQQVQTLPSGGSREQAAWKLYDAIAQLPVDPAQAAREPDDLDAIQALRPQSTPLTLSGDVEDRVLGLIDKTLYQLNFTTLNCDFSDFLPYLYSRQGG